MREQINQILNRYYLPKEVEDYQRDTMVQFFLIRWGIFDQGFLYPPNDLESADQLSHLIGEIRKLDSLDEITLYAFRNVKRKSGKDDRLRILSIYTKAEKVLGYFDLVSADADLLEQLKRKSESKG